MPMIKSELVQRISAQNPHLYQRDVENIVNAILGEIVSALARGDRVEPQSAHRRPCLGRPQERAVFQDRQGNARAPQPRLTPGAS
jgi:hypothetical protein